MADLLTKLRDANALTLLDEHLARALVRLGAHGSADLDHVLLAAAVASRATREGHVCLDLANTCMLPLEGAEGPVADFVWPELGAWLASLAKSNVVGDEDGASPLVLSGHRLYLRRYFSYEKRLAAMLATRIEHLETGIDRAVLRDGLKRFFPEDAVAPGEVDRQRLAALVAVIRRFCIVSGGPGTGKTWTVVKILALLVEQALHAKRKRLHIVLVAPTGKAANRLQESIQKAKKKLPCSPEVMALIPDEASTIHRCLSPIGGSGTRFRFDAENPIPCDVLLVDEASMVDLALMTRLVAAAPAHARIILLGDRDQLASVETGAILGDLCGPPGAPGFSKGFARHLGELVGEPPPVAANAPAKPGIWDCVVQLEKSYRYGGASGIAALARAIQENRVEDALAVLSGGDHDDVVLKPAVDPKQKRLGGDLLAGVTTGYAPYFAAQSPSAAFEALERYRVLCAHRQTGFGVETLNPLIEAAFAEGGLLRANDRFYDHRPILITQNDYIVKLFNGDVGVVLAGAVDDADSKLAHFIASDGGARALAPSRLPPHETVFAMTVHKAQGSEFDEIAFVLPDAATQVLTRELLYTAVTRPKSKVTIYGDVSVFAAAAARPVKRASGLRERLWGTPR